MTKQEIISKVITEGKDFGIDERVFDFLGSEIKVGARGLRVNESSHLKDYKKITVAKIDLTRDYKDVVGIITDGNTRIGWTYPHRLLVQESLTIQI